MKCFDVFCDDIRNGPMLPAYGTLIPNKDWVVVRRIGHMKLLLEAGLVNNLMLDHDFGNDDETGMDLLTWCEDRNIWPHGLITVHSANPPGKMAMLALLAKNGR